MGVILKLLIDYAMQFVGTPYKWGGSTHDGIDCSGLVQEILMSVGLDPSGDQTAQGLYDYFRKAVRNPVRGPGALVFYGKGERQITHIAFMIDEIRMIEAGGGGSQTLSRSDAERDNAFVRVRPYNRRKDIVDIVMIDYPEWVLNV
jgi:cell wall-associated NlpC family hydrolase